MADRLTAIMSGPDHLPAPLPDVPEEFSAAYREAYLRALADTDTAVLGTPLRSRLRSSRPWRDRRHDRWFWPAAFAVAAFTLIGGSYAVGAALSDGGSADDAGAGRTELAGSPSNGISSRGDHSAGQVPIGAVSADCTSSPGVDSAGRRVSYAPENAVDADSTSAWRCPGTAVGQKLVLRLDRAVDVAEVGLIPGYAKTDPANGADRYAENNRITRVRWTLGDGVEVVQRLDPDPSSRAMQVLRVPRTTTDTVTLEVLAVRRGPRNTTAISTIGLWAAR